MGNYEGGLSVRLLGSPTEQNVRGKVSERDTET
jgi:hypothetical protein